MAPEVDFLPFAVGAGANVESQATYAADSVLTNGVQAGQASSALANKTWRQASIMAAVIANLIANTTGQNVIDDGTTATIIQNLALAIRGLARFGVDGGVANAISLTLNPAITAYVDGLTVSTKPVAAPSGNATLEINGLGAKNIYGMNGSALQGGEYVANGMAVFQYNSSLNGGAGGFYLISSQGNLQVPPATQSNHAVSYGQIKNAVAPSASNAANSTTGISATTPSFTAPSKGILYITVTCFNGASGSGNISASASLGAVTQQTGQSNFEYFVWRGYIEMNAGDVTTVTGSYSGPNGDPTILVETTFTPNP